MNILKGCLQPCTGNVDKSDTDARQEGFLWFKDIGQQFGGAFSMAVVQANLRVEDENQVASGCLSNDDRGPYGTFVGIYDGHGGPEAARYISEHLFNNLKTEATQTQTISAEVIKRAIEATEEGFYAIVSERWVNSPHLASVGSCCLVGVICGGLLYIANLGDSRAVLGRYVRSTGEVQAVQLSAEHNANIDSIRQEMRSRHPQDPQIVAYRNNSWRVKGIIQVTRSIGDVYLKNPIFNRSPLLPKFRLPESFTDPILSAEPALCVTRLEPQDRFIIFASDGLWDQLSNQDAVDIVRTYKHRSKSARKLVKAAITTAARKIGSNYKTFKEAPGPDRRENHDDISVTVIFLDVPLMSRANTERTPPISVRSGPIIDARGS